MQSIHRGAWQGLRAQGLAPAAAANAVVAPFDLSVPSVPVVDVARNIGVEVLLIPSASWSGRLEYLSGSPRIIVSAQDAEPLARAMIAYELGRVLFSPLQVYEDSYRDTWENMAAEAKPYDFAMHLLMPEELLHVVAGLRGTDAAIMVQYCRPRIYNSLRNNPWFGVGPSLPGNGAMVRYRAIV